MSETRSTHIVTHWGPFIVDAEDDRIVAVHGHPSDPDPSPIGQALASIDKCRVARPSIRRSWLENGPGARTDLRGEEPFVEVGWDEALDLVAGELARVRDEHGHNSVFAGSYGWGSAGRFHQPGNQVYRFMRLFGGYTDAKGTYSASAAETIVPHVVGIGYHASIAQGTSWSVIADHTDLFVSFGGLRTSNTQVTFGGQGPHHTAEWMHTAAANGTEFVNISPLRDDLDEVPSTWIALRPNTDVALMAGLIHTLVVEDLADRDFLDRYCVGWERLEAYLTGADDGVAKTAAWAEEIAGLPAGTVAPLARRMASSRTFVNLTLGIQRGDHGEQPYWMGFALAAALGQIGLPGGGIGFPFGAQGNTGAGQVRKRVPGLPMPKRPAECTVISVSRVTELLERPGEVFHFDGRADVFSDIRLVYWAGGNVFHHHQDLNRLVRAWQRPETIVVHEPFWTPMAKRADIVLPTTTALERSDLGGGETILAAMQPVIEPLGEARDDFAVFAALADRLGFGEQHHENRTADEWVAHLYEEFASAHDYAPPLEQWRADGWVGHDMARMGEREQVYLAAFRRDPETNPLPTPSGRIELFSETIAGFGYDECPGLPTWMEPYERLGSDAAQRHPLHLVSNQPVARLHSQFDHSPMSRATKVAGREPIRLSPADASARGITDGDVVRVYNDRGACLAGAIVSDQLMEGVVQLSTGAWYDPDESGMCKHGNPNVLTRDKGTSELAQGPTAHTCLVEVERFDGEPPPVTAFDPPEFVERPS